MEPKFVAAMNAAHANDIELFDSLIDATPASLNLPFVATAGVGALKLLDWFHDEGVDVDACAPWTALEEAIYWGRQPVAALLLKRGARVGSLRAAADASVLDKRSNATPIGWARHAKHDDLANQLELWLTEAQNDDDALRVRLWNRK